MLKELYETFVKSINNLIDHTNKSDKNSVKRTKNYIEWCKTKTNIIHDEKRFELSDEQNNLIKRGNVIWVNFGFNIGSEFGGHHPAIIIKKMGNGVYVIPIDSGKIPETKINKNYYISIPYIYGFKNMPRHCNIYKMVCIDPRRFDFNGSYGKIHGKIMTKISNALKQNVIF